MISNKQHIRYSTDEDLHEILKWLEDQENNDVDATFYCNRNLTIEEHEEGKLIVYLDQKTNLAVAYQWGGLLQPGITEVRKEHRGQGIGKSLVKFRIKEARAKRKAILKIQCTPISSIPFWEHMGFTLSGRDNEAYMLLNYKNKLPSDATPCSVKICFFHEERKWKHSTLPVKIFNPEAFKVDKENTIYLAERVSYYDTSNHFDHDPVISIIVDDQELYLDKAKYKEARDLGVKRDHPAFYLDKIKTQQNEASS